MTDKDEKFSFFMGDDQFERFMKEIEQANKEKKMIKVEIAPRLKNVGHISFVKEVKKDAKKDNADSSLSATDPGGGYGSG